MARALGDLSPAVGGDGVINEDDLQAYQDAIDLNRIHSHWDNVEDPEDPGHRINKIIDIDNGGLLTDQARVASLHRTGFISNIDKLLISSFINDPQGETLEAHINAIDSKEVIPVPDPSVKTLEELRRNITDHIQELVIFQAQAFLELQKTGPSSLHDVEQKMQRVWADAYKYDYDTAAQTDANMEAALEVDGSKYPEDDGHKKLPQNIYGLIDSIIRALTKVQLDNVISEYWKPSEAPTISDPPTPEQQTKVIDHIWNETGVEKGLSFYNEWKDVEPSPEPGPEPTPTTDLVPPIPTAAALTGDLATWVSNSANASDLQAVIDAQHPHQIITCAFKSGVTNASTTKSVELTCWQYSSGTWAKAKDKDGNDMEFTEGCYVGDAGIFPVSELKEGDNAKKNRTPAGAFQLGNYTTNTDEVGAFGIDTAWGTETPDMHYRVLNANNVHWIDRDGWLAGLKNWYNMFANCDGQRALIQYKRFDWDTGVSGGVADKDGNKYSTASTEFKYGQFYTVSPLVDSSEYKENLYEETSSYGSKYSYNHAVVIRFNMPPHVTRPVLPKNTDEQQPAYTSDGIGAGSAYFLHTSNGSNTGGCVSANDNDVVKIIKWLKRNDNPYILIRLPSGS